MSRQPFSIPVSVLLFKDVKFLGYWMARWYQNHSSEERTEMLNDIIELIKHGKLSEVAYEEALWGNQSENDESLRNKFLNAFDKAGAGFHGKKQILKMQL